MAQVEEVNRANEEASTEQYDSVIQEWIAYCEESRFTDGHIVAPDKVADFLQDKVLSPISHTGKRKAENGGSINGKGKGKQRETKRSRLNSDANHLMNQEDLIDQLGHREGDQDQEEEDEDEDAEGEEVDLGLEERHHDSRGSSAYERVNAYLSALTRLWRTQVRSGTNSNLNPKNGPVATVIENARKQDEGQPVGRSGSARQIANGTLDGYAHLESLQAEMNQHANELRDLTQQGSLPMVAAMAELLVQYVHSTQQALSYLAASSENHNPHQVRSQSDQNHQSHEFQSLSQNRTHTEHSNANEDFTTASAIASISNSSADPTTQAALSHMAQYSDPSSVDQYQTASSSSASNSANIPTGKMSTSTQFPPGPIPPSGEFRMVRGLTTITEAYKEWKYGLHGHPSIEEKYVKGTDASWKKQKEGKRGAEVRFYQRRRNLIDFIETMAKDHGVDPHEVANKLETYRSSTSLSLHKTTDEARAGKITWEAIRELPEPESKLDLNQIHASQVQ